MVELAVTWTAGILCRGCCAYYWPQVLPFGDVIDALFDGELSISSACVPDKICQASYTQVLAHVLDIVNMSRS